MIEFNDKIAVAVSGGKDSLTLLYALSQIKNFYKSKFDIIAVTIDPCFFGENTDYSGVTNFCHENGIKHIIERHRIWDIVFKIRNESNPCSLCSRLRNGILHNICVENSCNKIALGHNMDDVIETFFMNLFSGGRISTFSPVSYLSRKKINIIRPLVFCEESEIKNFSKMKSFPVCLSVCPKDKNSHREDIKKVIENLEIIYPKLRKKIMNALERDAINGWDIK